MTFNIVSLNMIIIMLYLVQAVCWSVLYYFSIADGKDMPPGIWVVKYDEVGKLV